MNHMNRTTLKVYEIGVLERPRYFPRQLITPVEMTLEQTYFRDKLRRHNRLLHGWGVVCGAEVCAVRNAEGNGWEPWKVRVQSGYALAPMGDEISISKERVLDLRVSSTIGGADSLSGEMVDPWCRPVYQENLPEWVYVAVRYREVMTRQVRVQPAGCGCDDSSCEYSRICDGYEFGILPNCPDSHQNPPQFADVASLLSSRPEACLEHPDEDWIVLAAVRLEQSGRILAIDNCSCRRMIASFVGVWTKCTNGGLSILNVNPAEMEQDKQYEVTVTGTNFQPDFTVDLGPWATISNRTYTSNTEIRFRVEIGSSAPVGDQMLILTNPDCNLAVTTVKITEKQAETATGKVTDSRGREKTRRSRRR